MTAESLVEYLFYLLAVSKAEYSAAWLADLTAASMVCWKAALMIESLVEYLVYLMVPKIFALTADYWAHYWARDRAYAPVIDTVSDAHRPVFVFG